MEAIVAQVSDLADGDMKEVMVGETKVLLTKIKGQFQAIGNICTHYGGSLHEGCLSGHRGLLPLAPVPLQRNHRGSGGAAGPGRGAPVCGAGRGRRRHRHRAGGGRRPASPGYGQI